MEKRKNIQWLFPVMAAALLALLLFYFVILPESGDTPRSVLREGENLSPDPSRNATLLNSTSRPLAFLLKPLYEGGAADKKILEPGETIRFNGSFHREITLYPLEKGLIYWIFPGENYVIRDIHDAGHRIFKMAEGDPRALQLAPYVPSPMSVVELMLEAAEVDSDSVVYDLGCGDGRVVLTAAKKYGARAVGIDINPELIKKARTKAAEAGLESLVEFREQDILKADISDATVVYLYLLPDSNRLLRPFLERQLTPGTKVACHSFSMPGWQERLTARHEIEGEYGMPKIIYIYRWE
jgi:SAM-dependent methyltransferase